jgi:CHU_C Type IX secretion signal domain/SprB repeat
MRPFFKNIILGLILLGNSILAIAQNPNNRANIVVRNTSDNVRTAESFRWAVQQAAWSTQTNVTITFEFAAQLTTITLNSTINVYRNADFKTLNINGGGRIKLVGTGVKSNDGLNVDSEGPVKIYGLHLENFKNAIYFSSGTGSTLTIGNPGLSANVFTKNTTAIASLGYLSILNNYIGTDKALQQNLGNDNNIISLQIAIIQNNYIYSAKNDGVVILSAAGIISLIQNNIFGGSLAANGNKGVALKVIGDAFIENNTFRNNGQGIITTGKSELRNNNFSCNAASIFTPSQPYPKPIITAINYSQNGLVTISGTSNAEGDVIEIYTSSSLCPTLTCQGGRIKSILTNASRQWATTFTPAVGANVFITASKAGQYVPGAGDGGGIVQGSTSVFTDCQIPVCPPVAVNLQALNDVNCFGGNDGTAKLSITPTGFGGTYDYTLSKIDTSNIVAFLLPTPLVLIDTIKNLTSGRYKVTVRNKLTGCTYTTNEIIITEPIGSLSISTCREKTPASLNALDGVGEVLVNGGTTPYTLSYRKNNGVVVNFSNTSNSIFTIPNLGEGNYAVTVTDSKFGIGNPKTGCTTTCTFTMSPPNCTALKLSLKQRIDVKCFGDSSGSLKIKYVDILTNFPLTLTASNGFTQTITSFSPDSTVTIPMLKAGTYTISLRNNKNCPLSIAATITQYPKLDITCDTVFHAKRVGEASGAVRLTVRNGGPPPYRITLSGGRDTAFVFPSLFVQFEAGKLKAGNYVAQVKDNNDCVDTCKFIVKEPDCTGYDVIAVTDSISCFAAKNGRIDLSVVGGDSLYTYKWNNPNIGNVAIANNLDVGTYKATVSDGRNCSDSITAIIVTPSVLRADTTKKDVTIVDGKNGEISVTVSGGMPQYNVDLLFDSISIPLTERIGNRFVFKNLGKGVYIYLATDKNGCDTSGTIIIADPNCNMRLIAKADSVFCKGEKNGRVAINIINGTTPYTYKWSSNVIGNVFDTLKNVGVGLYAVTVTDSKNCKDSIQSTIFEPDSLLSTPSVNNVTTINGNDGSIRILVRGGKSPYTVKINNINGIQEFGNVFVFNNLKKGLYEYEVIDNKGCRTTKSVEITEPPCSIQIQDLVEPVLCQGQRNGRITVVVTGGTGALQYKWSDTNIGVTAIASNLAAATYTVTVTDSKNCTSEKSISVSEPTALASVFFKTDATTVNGKEGSIRLTVSGGTLPYKVRLGTASVIIESANTFVFNNLGKDFYTYTITDANQCPLSQDVVIDEPICNIQISPLVDNVKCNGEMTGRIALTVTNAQSPLSFEWNPFSIGNTNIITDLKANSYAVTLTDGVKCIKSLTINVTEPPKLTTKEDVVDVKKVGESTGVIRIKVSGGVAPYVVSLNNSNAVFERDSFFFRGLAKGNYTYTIKDANQCPLTQVVTINDPTCAISSQISISKSISCFGLSDGAIALNVQNGQAPQYSWSGGLGTVQNPTNVKAGTYTVSITDNLGCTDTKQITLTQPPQITATLTGDTAICNGQSTRLRFNVTGATAFNITFFNGATNLVVSLSETLVAPTVTTSFSLISIQSGVCKGIVSGNAIIQVTSVPTLTGLSVLKDSLCAGSDMTLNVTPSVLQGIEYVWETPLGRIATQIPTLKINNAATNNTGLYNVRASLNVCQSSPTPSVRVSVFGTSTEKAFAGVDRLECDNPNILLNARAIVSQNVIGKWISLDGANIAAPNSRNSAISNLKSGNNSFIWIISVPACGEVSRDTVTLRVEKKPVLTEATFNLEGSTSSILINLKEVLQDTTRFNLTITPPFNGFAAVRDEHFILFDRTDITGMQFIEIPYQVCSSVCPNLCAKNRLVINMTAISQDSSLRVPSIVVNDGTNIFMTIEGLDVLENNETTIVDRWGTPVFGPTEYKNFTPNHAWDLTKNGKPLPNGAYYILIFNKTKSSKPIIKKVIYLVSGS